MLFRNNKAFTLIEVMVVIVVIGVMAAMAIPNYVTAIEKTRAREGVQVLTGLLGAQLRFALENSGAYEVAYPGGLDVTFSIPHNFNDPTVENNGPGGVVARIQRSNNEYRLDIDDQGVIACVDLGVNTWCSSGRLNL